MSGDVDSLLGIGTGTKDSTQRQETSPTLYRLKRGDSIMGPHTLNQLRSMWTAGSVTADMEYAIEDGLGWRPILGLVGHLEANSAANTAINAIALQSRLKSTTVAVLLAILLPFVGAFYGSVGAALVPFAVGAVAGFGAVVVVAVFQGGVSDAETLWIWMFVWMSFSVWSIFWSLSAVKKHNAAVVTNAQNEAKA